MNFYLVHGTVLSKNFFIYIVLWAFPPYSPVSAFSIHTISFLCTLECFPFTFMPYMYSCFISIYILRGQFSQSTLWLMRNQNHRLSGLHSLFAARRWPLICFVPPFWWFSLFGDYVFLFIWVFSVIMNFSVKLILSQLGSKVWHRMRA